MQKRPLFTAVMSSRKPIMQELIDKLQKKLPGIIFEPGEAFLWSPEDKKIVFKADLEEKSENTWALLHETAHALLGHQNYHRDFELLLLEVAA